MKKKSWEQPIEKEEQGSEKQICVKCGNDTFRVYIKVIIDDASLYCSQCAEFLV